MSRETKERLLMDIAVCSDSEKRRTSIAIAWIDCHKAYDSVPHSWILITMELHGVNKDNKKDNETNR